MSFQIAQSRSLTLDNIYQLPPTTSTVTLTCTTSELPLLGDLLRVLAGDALFWRSSSVNLSLTVLHIFHSPNITIWDASHNLTFPKNSLGPNGCN